MTRQDSRETEEEYIDSNLQVYSWKDRKLTGLCLWVLVETQPESHFNGDTEVEILVLTK